MQMAQKPLVTYRSQVSVMHGHTSCFVLLEVSPSIISLNRHSCLHRGSFTDSAFWTRSLRGERLSRCPHPEFLIRKTPSSMGPLTTEADILGCCLSLPTHTLCLG